jgi:hypothetical protein
LNERRCFGIRHYDQWHDSHEGKELFTLEVEEIGVGTGRFAEALGIDLGVDPSAGALEFAVKLGIRVLHGKDEGFVCMRARKL